MTYESKIPADPDYLALLGRAFYNFTYMEWVVVWTIVKLSADGRAYAWTLARYLSNLYVVEGLR